MKAQPIPKDLFDKLKAAKVAYLTLNFMGGNDECNLDINYTTEDYKPVPDLIKGEINDWAWTAYNYSGAGDGSDYGDDVFYDLLNGKVRTQEWAKETVYSKAETNKMEVA